MLSDAEKGNNLMLTSLTPVATLAVTACCITSSTTAGANKRSQKNHGVVGLTSRGLHL